jgi:hypothetical protein
MDGPDDAPDGIDPDRRGRLHGRLLQVLGAVSAVAVAIALWQFGVFGGDPDRDPVGAVERLEAPSISDAAEDTSAAVAAPTAGATVESPSESTAAATSPAVSQEASEPLPPTNTTAGVEEADAAAGCSASLTLENEWEDSVEVTVEVVNSGGAALESWEVDLDLKDAEIYHYWNMRELGGGDFGSEEWNGRLDPGEDAIAGFQAEVDRHFDLPGSVSCTARA